MAAAIIDDIKRCEGCAAHYSVRVAAGLGSPNAQRWCTTECWHRKPTARELSFAARAQWQLDAVCRESGSGEWEKLLPAQRMKIWQQAIVQGRSLDSCAPPRTPAQPAT